MSVRLVVRNAIDMQNNLTLSELFPRIATFLSILFTEIIQIIESIGHLYA